MFPRSLFAAVFLVLGPALYAERVPGRYIVELTTEPVADHVARLGARGGVRGAAASTHRARLRTEQQQARLLIEQRNGTVLDSINTVGNALFVRISDSDAAKLATLPGVKRVLPVRTFHMVLDQAVILHNVTEVWDQIGSDRAGAGIKVAILDTGIDSGHAGFQDASLPVPDSFPRTNASSDVQFTNNKIIVARSYVSLLPNRDPDWSARDRVGHGTALAMIAAGVRNAAPLATLTGIAPKAYLGSYKVFGTPGYNDSSADDVILKAIDDAVSDGMDVINLSLGDDLAPRLADDLEAQAIERASQAGVIVAVAVGNNGPDLNTIASPATAPSAIAAGATTNNRTFAASVDAPGVGTFVAIPGSGNAPAAPVSGALVDVASLDTTGQACSSLPSGSLQNSIALILRGSCTFELKLTNAQRAGAAGAVVYAAQDSPSPLTMYVGAASLPAEMIGYNDGMAIKQALAGGASLAGTLQFTLGKVAIAANRLTDFTAVGPSVDLGVKPDLMAVGGDVYTATQSFDPNGEMYDPSGFVLVDGTSFSTPMVAGTAALIKSVRPGLSTDQYRSLLINTAAPVADTSVEQSGAGLLDANAALHSTVTSYPTSLSFGAGGADPQLSRTLTITNVGSDTETFQIAAVPRNEGPAPTFSTASVELAAGGTTDLGVVFAASGLTSGGYEGFITITGASSGTVARVPYWYATTSDTPSFIAILDSTTSARRGSMQRDAILFRVTDAAGVALPAAQAQVSVVSGGGAVGTVHSYDADVPGLFGVDVQLGFAAGQNVFQVQAGPVTVNVSITGQ